MHNNTFIIYNTKTLEVIGYHHSSGGIDVAEKIKDAECINRTLPIHQKIVQQIYKRMNPYEYIELLESDIEDLKKEKSVISKRLDKIRQILR